MVIFMACLMTCCLCLSCAHDPFSDLQSDNPVKWSDAVDLLSKNKDPRLVEPLIDALKNGSRHVRKKAAGVLGKLGDPRAVDPLVLALNDEYWEVRRNAVRSLARLGDERAASPLVEVLHDEEYDVRYAAVKAVTTMSAETTPLLIASLAASDANVRQGAAGALSAIGWRPAGEQDRVRYLVASKAWEELARLETSAVPVLVEALKYDDKATRKGVDGTLRKIGDRAEEALAGALTNENSIVRERAARILESMAWRPGTVGEKAVFMIARKEWSAAAALGEPAEKQLITVLNDRNGDVRQEAARALERAGWRPVMEKESIAFFIALREWDRVKPFGAAALESMLRLLNDRDVDIRKDAVILLGAIGDSRAIPALNGVLKDEACDVRKVTIGVLGEMGDERSLESLILVMQDRECDVRSESAAALKVYGSRAVAPLVAVLSGRSAYAREGAAGALGKIGDAGAVEALCTALEDDGIRVRKEAAVALGLIADGRAAKPLIAALQDHDGTVREEAVKALGIIAPPEAVEPLVAALLDGDNNSYIRAAAAEALGNIGGGGAAEHLRYVLKDPSARVRKNAAEALGKIGDADGAGPLVELLSDSAFEVRNSAAGALDETGWTPQSEDERVRYQLAMKEWNTLVEVGSPAVTALVEAMREEDSDVRDDIGETLRQIGAPAVEPLVAELREGDPHVQSQAATVLGGIGDRRALEGLVEVLGCNDQEVRKRSAEALGAIGDQGAVDALVNHLPDWWAGGAVAEALSTLRWVPRGERERIHMLVAERDFKALREEWNVTRRILMQDMDRKNSRIVENALFALLEAGGGDVVPELVTRIESRGTAFMTEAYLNSNEPELIRAAEKWASQRGYTIRKE